MNRKVTGITAFARLGTGPRTKLATTLGVVALGVCVLAQPAAAQDPGPVGIDEAEETNTREIEEDLAEAQVLKTPVHYGIGVRLRYVTIPKFMIEQFFEEVTAGISSPGFGLDFVRRKGDFELTVGIEYESLNGTNGFWLEKGDDAVSAGEAPDFVEFSGFGWVTLDANFVFLKNLGASKFAIRYGGGFGLGLMLGEVLQTDSTCTGRDINGGDCAKNTGGGGQINDPASIPPVFPVINALAGLQFRPTPQVVINAELGIRTAPFMGISGQYFF